MESSTLIILNGIICNVYTVIFLLMRESEIPWGVLTERKSCFPSVVDTVVSFHNPLLWNKAIVSNRMILA